MSGSADNEDIAELSDKLVKILSPSSQPSQQSIKRRNESVLESTETPKTKATARALMTPEPPKITNPSSLNSTLQKKKEQSSHVVSRRGLEDMVPLTKYEQLKAEKRKCEEDSQRRMESYIRREKKYQEEIEGLKDKLKQHQDVLSADVQMENIRKQHAQVLRRLANMKSNFVGYLGEHETKLITAFRVKLYDVMHESDEKKQDQADSQKWQERVYQLERNLTVVANEAQQQAAINKKLKDENKMLMLQFQLQEDDMASLVKQLKATKDNLHRQKLINSWRPRSERASTAASTSSPQRQISTAGDVRSPPPPPPRPAVPEQPLESEDADDRRDDDANSMAVEMTEDDGSVMAERTSRMDTAPERDATSPERSAFKNNRPQTFGGLRTVTFDKAPSRGSMKSMTFGTGVVEQPMFKS